MKKTMLAISVSWALDSMFPKPEPLPVEDFFSEVNELIKEIEK